MYAYVPSGVFPSVFTTKGRMRFYSSPYVPHAASTSLSQKMYADVFNIKLFPFIMLQICRNVT